VNVSVIIPAKNAAAYIGEAISSALAQGPEVREVVVVDDGSTDRTRAIVEGVADPRVRLITGGGCGVSAARNKGADAACGKWLMFLDADDRLRPGAVEALLDAAVGEWRAVAIYGDYCRIDRAGRTFGARRWLRRWSKPSGQILRQIVAGNFIVNGGVMIVRAASFAAVGGFSDTLTYCEDWHCWCRLAALGEFKFIPRLILDYRVHAASAMNGKARSVQDFLPSVKLVFSDCAIVEKIPDHLLASLRSAAELHLIVYAAAQAMRFRNYRKTFAYVAMAGRRSGAAAPGMALRLGLAFLGV
jgi:glycosyltransferase involved in cell wall biosynthesis